MNGERRKPKKKDNRQQGGGRASRKHPTQRQGTVNDNPKTARQPWKTAGSRQGASELKEEGKHHSSSEWERPTNLDETR